MKQKDTIASVAHSALIDLVQGYKGIYLSLKYQLKKDKNVENIPERSDSITDTSIHLYAHSSEVEVYSEVGWTPHSLNTKSRHPKVESFGHFEKTRNSLRFFKQTYKHTHVLNVT